MHVVMEQIPHQYAVKTAIETLILIVTLYGLCNYEVQDKVAVIVRNSEVEITTGAATKIFFKELNECFIQGFTREDDDGSYLAEFDFELYNFLSRQYDNSLFLSLPSPCFSLSLKHAVVDVTFPGAAFLKQTLSWLINVAGQSDTATVNFHRDGISLLASPPDRSVITLVRINSESFSFFHVDNDPSWSCDVNLNRLRIFLNLAGDKDSVGIYALHFTTQPFWVKLTFKKPDSKVTFTAGVKKTVISRELLIFTSLKRENEYIIERVVREDDSPSVVVFSLKHFRSMKDLIRRSNSVWIYLPYVGDSPAGLSFSVDPIGEISYFFP
ncbi:hypothetical protein ACOSQ2_003668 [Xanthoceras sorbifolium]